MNFDLATSLRRLKPQRRAPRLGRRADGALDFVPDVPEAGAELLLDTCVYIDVVQGRTPPRLDRLLGMRILNHSTIALAELTHLFGRLDPAHAATRPALARVSQAIDMIPPHRLSAPSPRAFAEAGMLAGLVARLSGEAASPTLLMDALLMLHALESGRVLVTRNIKDFDRLQLLEPRSRVIFYRQV